jgi:hypothetical protein
MSTFERRQLTLRHEGIMVPSPICKIYFCLLKYTQIVSIIISFLFQAFFLPFLPDLYSFFQSVASIFLTDKTNITFFLNRALFLVQEKSSKEANK